jgi:GTP-binding protein
MIKNAKFLTSVADENLLNTGFNEYAFVGRSNCGKSSLINSLTNNNKLAKTSSTPGHTKLVNYFLIEGFSQNEKFVLVDLPGYGYSKAGKKHEKNWPHLIENYLLNSKNLKHVFMLTDIRHEPNQLDELMINFLYSYNLQFTIIATKADKIAKSKLAMHTSLIARKLKIAC